MHPFPLHKLGSFLSSNSFESTFPRSDKLEKTELNQEAVTCQSTSICIENTTENGSSDQKTDCVAQKRKHSLTDEEKQAIRTERLRKRYERKKQSWKLLEYRDMDALIVASK